VWDRVEQDVAFSKSGRNDRNHYERYIDSCRKIRRYKEILDEVRKEKAGVIALGEEQQLTLDEMYDLYIAIDENLPIDVHLSMFIPLMMYHTSPEQKERWLEDALNLRMIGAYAQTEIAHGSNVRGIETIALFNEDSQCFDLHSPTLTSLKWWPGGLGHTATHAVVYANLVIGRKTHGIHAFMVQLRDRNTHRPMPGVECGDIGPKLGYNSMDNGYAKFSHVQVPREDMLSGFAQVAPNGAYSKQPGAEKVAYGIMLDVRCRIVANSAYVLARALTISIRYSYVRVQGGGTKLTPAEKSVIQYPSQQRLLAPLLALAYALHFTGTAMRQQYSKYSIAVYGSSTTNGTEAEEAVASMLPRLHLESAGLKALVTALVADGMERCRKACGGHGFLSNAGFGDLLTSYLPMCTLEGTREVLGQQTGRSLLKLRKMKRIKKKNEGDDGDGDGDSIEILLSMVAADGRRGYSRLMSPPQFKGALKLLSKRVDLCLDRAEATITRYARDNTSTATALMSGLFSGSDIMSNSSLLSEAMMAAGADLVAASEAYCEYLILRNFAMGISDMAAQPQQRQQAGNDDYDDDVPKLDTPTLLALQWLWQLLFLTKIEEHGGDFCACGVVPSADALDRVVRAVGMLCECLVPDLVCLVEAWQISDTRLDSTLGRFDGQYVEALYDAALQEPLNRMTVSEGYTSYLKDVLGERPFASSRL
jgi:acyl-CoA oxidase